MDGVSGIVATAIMLSLTIAGGVFIYAFVTSYLNNVAQESRVAVENAYYIGSLKRLVVEIRNIGPSETQINTIRIVFMDDNTREYPCNLTISSGVRRTIELNLTETTALPRYVIVKYNNNGTFTDPVSVKVY